MKYGVSRNRIDHTEFWAVSLQEGIQSGFTVSNFILLTLDDITVALIYIQHVEHTLYLIHIQGML